MKYDILIWLDYDFWYVFYCAVKRTFSRVIFKKECCNGNYESLHKFWEREDMPTWVWKTHGSNDWRIHTILKDFKHLKLIHFKYPYQCDLWIKQIENVICHKKK